MMFGSIAGNEARQHSECRVATTVIRMEHGNLYNAKSVEGGVFEYRMDFGPGYRVYFGKDGDTLIILLGGGTRKRQQKDAVSSEMFVALNVRAAVAQIEHDR